jgi:curved DNA-binding protein CbpA
MKDYYDLLRIPRTATDAEVKQAFRRLAILLHPDKNPHPDAPAAFQELNEAYEVLGDPASRVLYDQMLGIVPAAIADEPVIRHRDPAYRRKKDPNYRPPKPEPSAGYTLMMKLMPMTNWVASVAFAISLFVWVDFALPRKVLEEEVIETHRTFSHHIMTTNKGHSFDILYPQNRNFIREPLITVYASQLFSFLDYIETRSGSFQYTNVPSVFHNLMFGPLVLVILSAFGLVLPKGEVKFNISIAIAILLILNLVFIAQSVW